MHSLLNTFWIFDWKAYLKKLGQPTCFDMVDPYYEVQQIHNSYYEIRCMKQVKGYWAATTHTHHCLNIFLDFYILAHFWYCVLFVHDCSSSNICSIHFVFHCVPTWLRMAHTPGSCHHISEFQKLSQWINPSKKHIQPVQHWKHLWTKKKKPSNQPTNQVSKQANKQTNKTNKPCSTELNTWSTPRVLLCGNSTYKNLEDTLHATMEILRGEISSELCCELRSLGATEVLDVQAGLKNAHAEPRRLDDLYSVLKTNMAPENHPSSPSQPSFFGAMLIFGSV